MENFLAAMQCFEKSDKMSIVATFEIANATRLMELICEANDVTLERGFARIAGSGEDCIGDFFDTLVTSMGKMPKMTVLICDGCGHINSEGSNFCCKCGKNIRR